MCFNRGVGKVMCLVMGGGGRICFDLQTNYRAGSDNVPKPKSAGLCHGIRGCHDVDVSVRYM